MENFKEKILNKLVGKNIDYISKENVHPESFDSASSEEEFTPENALEKQLKKTHDIDQELTDIVFMDDKRSDIKEILKNVEANEIYYLTLKSKIKNLERLIGDLLKEQEQVANEKFRDIHEKLSLCSQKNEEYNDELKSIKKILDSYPEKIYYLNQELKEYEEFLNNYKKQEDNFYDN